MTSIFANLGRRAEKKAPDEQDEAEKARKAKKKAKGEKDDEEDDSDDDETESAKADRARERPRVRAIFTSGPGLANPVVAAHMALDTSMPRASAIAAIGSLNAAIGVPDFDPDEGDASSSMASAILAAGAKARGETAPLPLPPGRRERMGVRPEARSAQPRSDMVAEILAAGRKARGED